MGKEQRMMNAARLLAAGMVLLGASSAVAGPGPMEVEEPALAAQKPPIQPEKEQAAWKVKKNGHLTTDQKAALKARQERMDDMVALIRQKRRAIKEAKPKDREALALELHNLILEKSQTGQRVRARGEGRKDSSRDPGERQERPENQAENSGAMERNARVKERLDSKAELKARQQELREEILRQKEARRKAIEEKLKQLESRSQGNGSGQGERD